MIGTSGHGANLAALGVFVRERRRALGLTQSRLGDRLGWVQERISLLECGKYGTPSIAALARLADALEVPQAEVLRAAGYLEEVEEELVSRGREGQVAPGDAAHPERLLEGITGLNRESRRLREQVVALHDRLQAVQTQMEAVDQLRHQMSRRRQEIEVIMTSLQADQPRQRLQAT